jgi:GR25 family glycosyltransferase involved in LPS biosynthesis
MKAVSIVIKDNAVSEFGYSRLVESSQSVDNYFDIVRYDAITPDKVDNFMEISGIKWNYPWEGEVVDFATGLKKSAYKTVNPKARMACACSHYSLWQESSTTNTTMLILEHDAYFTNKIDFDPKDIKADILGINNPLGATRKSQLYYDMIMQSVASYQLVPWIDNAYVPQGLAGNSAYIIKPSGAKYLIELVKQYGLWPNDAIMCRQLVPRLGVTRKFYTNIQGLKSTTSL